MAAIAELPELQNIERTAARLFATVGLAEVAESEPTPSTILRHHQAAGRVWVAADDRDRPVGFAIAAVIDGCGYLQELSVHPAHSRRGLGTRLVETVCRWAKHRGYPAVTLSTFGDLPWNAPFYQKLGFRILGEAELTPGLLAVRTAQAKAGFPVERRVFLKLDFLDGE
ncbi:MAG: GNAT family N-acetyltransferase [Limnospira sp.]